MQENSLKVASVAKLVSFESSQVLDIYKEFEPVAYGGKNTPSPRFVSVHRMRGWATKRLCHAQVPGCRHEECPSRVGVCLVATLLTWGTP